MPSGLPSPEPPRRPVPLVTHAITRLIVGGAQENTIWTVLGLQPKQEYRTELVSGPTHGSEGSLESELARAPGVLTIAPSLIRPLRPLADLQGLAQLRQHFRTAKPVLVHTHSGKAGILGRWAARLEGVPVIVHGIHGPSFGPWQGAAANFIFRAAERSAGRITTHFAAVANAMIEQYRAAGIGAEGQFTRIFSGFPLERFLAAKNDPALRAKYGLAPDDFVIGKIARLFELKGHDDLFAIAPEFIRKFPKAKFLLVGGGPWEERFKEMARGMGLEKNFVFTGLVPPAEIPGLAGIMDALAHLSLREGLPRAIPQALAAGKPVAAYDCDGAREVCITGQTGFLIPRQNRARLLEALEALASKPALRAELGAAGREFVRGRFPVERMVEDTHQLYLRLLGERGLLGSAKWKGGTA